MDKAYIHSQYEDRMYQLWEERGAFAPRPTSSANPFCIIMPPPNANDPLHVGHAMFATLEDIMIRYHRMLGDDTLWLPGTDHAGIETQFVYERKLKKDGKSRFQFDRETLFQMVWDYVQENSQTAVSQLKKMGASADWSRLTFTLDPKIVDIVLSTFEKLYDKKLIYRSYSLVNFCTKCGTAFSELEVDHKEQTDAMYYLKFGPFIVATVRPETMFRDVALAANPDDKRYKKYIGQTIEFPGLLGPMKMIVIGDKNVDPAFGTGIMKVTPAHDANDFALGKEHDLPVTPIIDFQGKMDLRWFLDQTDLAPEFRERAARYHSLKVLAARKLIVEDLQAAGLIEKIDDKYTHNIGVCYRCGTQIEPLPLAQFFIKVKPLTKPVLQALKDKKVVVHGAGHDKILKHWLTNLKDWNISRQIVWGIRLPIWYDATKHPEIEVGFLDKKTEQKITGKLGDLLSNKKYTIEEIKSGLQELRAPITAKFVHSPTSPGPDYLQDTDTFDTWFSSTQWPFATLQTNQPGDFERFYPTQVMETGYDILPFWVMRMLMMGLFATGKVPFTTVYLHGLVRDQHGQKMSKSKGNVINPLIVIEQYGADALRMALVIRSSAGLDKSVGESDFRAMRNFTNKIWNAARFIQLEIEKNKTADKAPKANDQEFLKHLNQVTADITQQLNDFKFGMAAETAYTEFWHWFCDSCIEEAKQGKLSLENIQLGLETFLKLLHPFMPFVTETIWQELGKSTLLVTESWPKSK